jgi:Cft2 family RNA processing exonuclease
VLRDRGLFQGHRQEAREIDKQLALAAEQLNAIVLSHAHIDHSGNLPLLVKQRNRGPAYDAFDNRMCETMLKDSAHIKESDAEFVKRRAHRRRSIGSQRTAIRRRHCTRRGTRRGGGAVQASDDAYSAAAGGADWDVMDGSIR